MPLETVAPAPQITWPYKVQYPGGWANRRSRETFRDWADVNRIVSIPGAGNTTNGPNAVTSLGQGESSATAGDLFDLLDGVACSNTTTAPRCAGWSFPWWAPVFDGSLLPSGFRVPEGGVVGVIDVSLRLG